MLCFTLYHHKGPSTFYSTTRLRTLGTCKEDGVVNLRETWPESIHICFIFLSRLKPIFHCDAKLLVSGTFASGNAKNNTFALPGAKIPTCWYLLC